MRLPPLSLERTALARALANDSNPPPARRPAGQGESERSDGAARVTISADAIRSLKLGSRVENPDQPRLNDPWDAERRRVSASYEPPSPVARSGGGDTGTNGSREMLERDVLRDLRRVRGSAAARPEFVAKMARRYPAVAAAMLVMSEWSRAKAEKS